MILGKRLAMALPPVLFLTACAVGPDFVPPTPAPGALDPLVSFNPKTESAEEPSNDWWELFDDPVLERLVNEAFQANADLAAAESNLSSARAILDAARSGSYPRTVAETGSVYGRDVTTDEILEIDGNKPQTTWLFDDILDVSYELDLFGRVRRSIEASRADTEAAAAGRDALRITVAAETARAYAQICTTGEEITVAQHSLDIVSREAQITEDRNVAGANSRFEVVRAQGFVALVKSDIPPLLGQRRAALFELTALLGRTPSHAPTEALACNRPPQLTALIPVGDGAGLLKRRPDVREAERRLAAATARIGVATADLYPRISLSGFYGGASTELSGLSAERGLAWGLGPTISWTFPIQAEPRARVRKAKADALASLATFDSVVLRALKETEQTLSIYSAEITHREDLIDAQAKAREAFNLAHAQFSAGSLSNLDLLISEQTLINEDAAVAKSNAVLAQDQIAVFKALGGGWKTLKSLPVAQTVGGGTGG